MTVMHVVASVQARLGSKRLPGKVLLRLGDQRILQWVLDRVEAAAGVDETVAAVGDNPENDAITEYCNRENVRTIVGSEENLLSRHLAVAKQTGCDLFVRVTADCPFVPTAEIDRIVAEHRSNDARYTTSNTDAMPIGTAVDVIDPDLLSELSARDETHPVRCLRNNPQKWGTAWSPNADWNDVRHVHMAIDTPGDYWSLIDGVDAVGETPRAIANWLADEQNLDASRNI